MPILITGGCGFIGTNLAHRLLLAGQAVHLFDNLSMPGSEQNMQWLRCRHGDLLSAEIGDIRDWRTLSRALRNASQVYHLAAQDSVAVSREDPSLDFEVNARGTFHLLNAIRELDRRIPLVYTSTSKVYGSVPDLKLRAGPGRYRPCERRHAGIHEGTPLQLEGPYGCSKGLADQYVLDFARTYLMPTVVLRIGTTYGPHQTGTEEQGWVVQFLRKVSRNQAVTLYGDGKQVRDLLEIEDLINALLLAPSAQLWGKVFNIGGGTNHSVSLIELLELMGRVTGRIPHVRFAPWRPGDAKYYVSNYGLFSRATRWDPRVGVRDGIERLYRWMVENREAIPPIAAPTVAFP